MSERKPISKTLRFEVFKRDSFTCQYCGLSAPAVVLHCDHIQPVAKEGDNDPLNLITSCIDCNLGKSDRLLSDDSAIQKRKGQLDELQERREQIEMMLEWRSGLKSLADDEVRIAIDAWDKCCNCTLFLSEDSRRTLGQQVKKYGLQSVLEAIDIAADKYLDFLNGTPTLKSLKLAFAKLPGICHLQSQPEWKRELYIIRGILRNRVDFKYNKDWQALQYMENAYNDGVPLEDMRQMALRATKWNDWLEELLNARKQAQRSQRYEMAASRPPSGLA